MARAMRRPLVTILSAISFVCLVLTLSAWAVASVFPRSRFNLIWHDAKHKITARSEITCWGRDGVITADQQLIYRDADEDGIAPGFEKDPYIVKYQQQKRLEWQAARTILSRLAPPETRRVVWTGPAATDLETLLAPQMRAEMSSRGERYSFSAPVKWFAILPSLWVAVGFRDYLRKKHERVAGRCIKWGYDLRATPSRCPECGTRVELGRVTASR